MQENEDPRRKADIMVAGYLLRCNYAKAYGCLIEESPGLRSHVQCASGPFLLDDRIQGKNLDEIITIFDQCGNFGRTPAFFDFGRKLRDLSNEYEALTNPDFHYSTAQKALYGKLVPPSSQVRAAAIANSQQTEPIYIPQQALFNEENVETSNTTVNYSSSARRKCVQPVSTKNRLVENVMQVAQHVIENRDVSAPVSYSDSNTICLDEGVMDSLDACVASYFPEMVASEFDIFDLPGPSSVQNGFEQDASLHSVQSNLQQDGFQQAENAQDFSMNLTDIPQLSEPVVVPVNEPSNSDGQLPHGDTAEQMQLHNDVTAVYVNKSSKGEDGSHGDATSSRGQRTEKKRLTDRQSKKRSKEKQKGASDTVHRKGLTSDDLPKTSSTSSIVAPEYDLVKTDVQKKNEYRSSEIMRLTVEDLFDDGVEEPHPSQVASCSLSEHTDDQKDELEKVNGLERDKGSSEPVTYDETSSSDRSADVERSEKVFEPLPAEVIKNDHQERITEKYRKSADDRKPEAAGWVKLTTEKRDAVEGSIPSDGETRDNAEAISSVLFEEQSEQITLPQKSVSEADANSRNSLEEGELLPTPQKSKISSDLEERKETTGKTDRKNSKGSEESSRGDLSELSKKERRKKELELKMRQDRELVDKLKQKQREDERIRAADRELRRKKELEKEAKEREEREKHRRKLEQKKALIDKRKVEEEKRRSSQGMDRKTQRGTARSTENLAGSRRETDKKKPMESERSSENLAGNTKEKDRRRQKETMIDSENLNGDKNKNFVIPRVRNRDKSSRANEKRESSLEERLFGSDEPVRKHREEKRDVSESRQLPKKPLHLSGKELPANSSKNLQKEEAKSKNEREGKAALNERQSTAKKNKIETVSQNQPLSLDYLFEAMAAPPGLLRKEEPAPVEPTKDFLKRILAKVEGDEKSGNERTKKSTSSGYDSGNERSRKTVSSGYDTGRPNLLVRGGHSARVGMVFEQATRRRRKHEHEAALVANSQNFVTERKNADLTKISVASSFPSSSSDKDIVHRKRILDLPLPKNFSVDLVGDILKETGRRGTRIDSLKRYEGKRSIGDQGERSPLFSSAESSHASSLASASPRSFSSPDINTPGDDASSVSTLPLKKPRLEVSAIDSVLDSLYGSSAED